MENSPVRPSADVIFRELEGEAVLLDLGSGRYFGLNAVGTRVWMLIEAASPMEHVIAAIADEFEADREEIARDVRDLVSELTARGLLVGATGAPPPSA